MIRVNLIEAPGNFRCFNRVWIAINYWMEFKVIRLNGLIHCILIWQLKFDCWISLFVFEALTVWKSVSGNIFFEIMRRNIKYIPPTSLFRSLRRWRCWTACFENLKLIKKLLWIFNLQEEGRSCLLLATPANLANTLREASSKCLPNVFESSMEDHWTFE